MSTHTMEKKTKLAESGIVNVDVYGLTTHAHAIGHEIDDRFPPSQDQSTENNIYPNEVVWCYDFEQPDLVQNTKGKYQIAEDGVRFVFSTINRMPCKARIIPFGVSMGTFIANDKSTWKLSVAIEGCFSIPNTGSHAFQVGDLIVGDVSHMDSKMEPVRVGRHQKGRMYPIIYPLSKIKSQFEDFHCTVQMEMNHVLDNLKMDAKRNGMSVKDKLKAEVAELSKRYPTCFTALDYLEKITKSGGGDQADFHLIKLFCGDTLQLIREFELTDHQTFFTGVLLNGMSINQWLIDNPTLINEETTGGYTILHGKLFGAIASCAIFYDQELFQKLKHKVFAFAMSDAKVGERVDAFVGRTGG